MTSTDRLRYIPPVAALGTAFVLQTVAITDTVGGVAAPAFGNWAYLPACLLGIAVASCAEGGAAYLMDLYDRHLLARDSVWLLRLAMFAYVAVSGLAIHWWTEQRGLPTIISWLLSGMTASSLFLWARGARWRNRLAMIEAGQIDPALPRLPMSAKLLHPLRWAATLYLISWQPVATTDQARARYEQWRDKRTGRQAATELYVRQLVADAQAGIDAAWSAAEADLSAYREQTAKELSDLYGRAGERAAAVLSAAHAEADRIRTAAISAHDETSSLAAAAQQRADHLIRTAEQAAERLREQAAGVLDEAHRRADAERDMARDQAESLRLTARRDAQDEASKILAEADAVRRAADEQAAETARLHAEAVRRLEQAKQAADTAKPVRLVRDRTANRQVTGQAASTRAEVSVEQLADTLDERSPDRVPGRPTAVAILREVYGSCSGERAKAAMDLLSARRNGQRTDSADDQERLPVTPINGHRPELVAA